MCPPSVRPVTKSKASRFNAHVLKKLQAAVNLDPKIDLTTKMPAEYSNRLEHMKSEAETHGPVPRKKEREEEDIRTYVMFFPGRVGISISGFGLTWRCFLLRDQR
ncbi:hypothetical protein BJY00DRAFT_296945 [Aspergillus carlsbadensis]|nr:hypothetical protein BJY00DRAFT_296945 [Aspergillus carlsbadensis]